MRKRLGPYHIELLHQVSPKLLLNLDRLLLAEEPVVQVRYCLEDLVDIVELLGRPVFYAVAGPVAYEFEYN